MSQSKVSLAQIQDDKTKEFTSGLQEQQTHVEHVEWMEKLCGHETIDHTHLYTHTKKKSARLTALISTSQYHSCEIVLHDVTIGRNRIKST